ncbi:pyridoxamine 5'-phosphate oxidase family protein [Oceanispirochaeta crateris]|nr:pyridoxamine 5'-phosphate oxidase family protein [Oceanispirochaeta crateris]
MMMHNSECFFDDISEMRGILSRGKYTSLALSDGNDPYIITLSFGLDPQEETLYLYGLKTGTKIDFLKSNSYVCGTVILEKEDLDSQSGLVYESLVYRGLVEVLHNAEERMKALNCIADKLYDAPSDKKSFAQKITDNLDKVLIMKLIIDEMTGRRNRTALSDFS